jgi:hypothetical protein
MLVSAARREGHLLDFRESISERFPTAKPYVCVACKELKLATFNSRAEIVAEKPFFRGAFKRNRCLIPISSHYEWQDTPGGKQPWYFTARDGSPALTIASLWDEWNAWGRNRACLWFGAARLESLRRTRSISSRRSRRNRHWPSRMPGCSMKSRTRAGSRSRVHAPLRGLYLNVGSGHAHVKGRNCL